MMINKLQTVEDVESFCKLPGSEIETILKDSPEHLVEAIANVLRAFLLKMNVPVRETEMLTDKVREKKMGELFADMEKIDIQAERANTAFQRQRAEDAERQAVEEKQRADDAEKQAVEERQRAEDAERQAVEERQRAEDAKKQAVEERQRADDAERQVAEMNKYLTEEKKRVEIEEENGIRLLVELNQEFGASMDAAVQNLMDKKNMGREEAMRKVEIYWKDCENR